MVVRRRGLAPAQGSFPSSIVSQQLPFFVRSQHFGRCPGRMACGPRCSMSAPQSSFPRLASGSSSGHFSFSVPPPGCFGVCASITGLPHRTALCYCGCGARRFDRRLSSDCDDGRSFLVCRAENCISACLEFVCHMLRTPACSCGMVCCGLAAFLRRSDASLHPCMALV